MSSTGTTSSVTSSSDEEDAKETHDTETKASKCDEEKDTSGQKDIPGDSKSPDDAEEALGENEGLKDMNRKDSKASEDELVIEYTVEVNRTENQLQTETTEDNPKEELSDDKEITPTPEIEKVEEKEVKEEGDESKEPAKKEPDVPAPIEVKAPPEIASNSEVVEEGLRSVKEQIAIFANLNIQETHGTPKPGVAGTFGSKQENANKSQPEPSDQAPLLKPSERNAALYENASPHPFNAAETEVVRPVEKQPAESHQPPQQPAGATFERPQPLDRPSNPPPQPKKFVINKRFTSSPMTFGTPFGNGSQQVKATEVAPSQYLGPDVIAQTSRPTMMIRLRRPGPEAPWGFAVFGGTDYGCPPFISRVTLHSIAARAGLEVGDVVVSICDTPVQGKNHSQIKAEILRAGNELDFVITKQGIDKEILAKRAPHLLQSSATSLSPSVNYNQIQKATGTWSSAKPSSPSYADKVTRTRSFRLLDEHLNAMSSQPVLTPTMSSSMSADIFSPSLSHYNEYPPQTNYNMGRSYQATNTSNYTEINRTSYSGTYSPGMNRTVYVQQSQPITELNTNRTYLATPAKDIHTWHSPNRVYYDTNSRSARPNNWSLAPSTQQINYYEGRNSIERSSADDPGLMTQYYGTQQTCYARYYPPSHHRQEEIIHRQSIYRSSTNSGWNDASPQQLTPTNRLVYQSPSEESRYLQTRKCQTLQPQQNYATTSSNYQDQERFSVTGSIQTHNTGWV